MTKIYIRGLSISGLALLAGVLALLLFAAGAGAQTRRSTQQQRSTPQKQQKPAPTKPLTTEELGEPPPLPTPKPTPTPAAPPATAGSEQDYDVVRVTSNLVVVPVSVTDAKGQPVTGLTTTDFRLEEEGRPQEIVQIGDPEQVPLDIAILLDVSSSVSKRFEFEQQAATRFLKEVLKPADRAAVFAIDQQPRLIQKLSTVNMASAHLMALQAATGPSPTAFYDTVVQAAQYLAQNSPSAHRRVVVVISDGEDNFSNSIRETEITLAQLRGSDEGAQSAQSRREQLERHRNELHSRAQAEVLREVQRDDVVFYSINPSGESYRLNKISTRAQEGMKRLADDTGGTAFTPNQLEELETVFRQITNELRAQYLLQYYSQDKSPSGKFLRIKVGVPSRSGVRVRARQGYYSRGK